MLNFKNKKYRELEKAYNTLENKVMTLEDILANELLKTLENNDAKTLAKYKKENASLRKKIKILKEMISDGECGGRTRKNKSSASRKK